MKHLLVYLSMATVVTALVYVFSDIGIGWATLVSFLGWPLLGTLVTADEDLPDGWANPDGTRTPDWETRRYWGRLFGGGAVVCLAFYIQFGMSISWAIWFIPATLGFVLLSCLLLRRAHRASRTAG